VENSEERRVRKLTWLEYGNYIERFCGVLSQFQAKRERDDLEFNYVFGSARGGLPIAVSVSHYLGIPLLVSFVAAHARGEYLDHSRVLGVDDIIDTGATRRKYPNVHWCSIFTRPETAQLVDRFVEVTEDWIQFPYELDSESVVIV
jgi:orotate phosphoribosyltransferase-like protein